MCIFLFKQKTAYEMRISDWSSDVCSSDLPEVGQLGTAGDLVVGVADRVLHPGVGGEDEVGGEQGADVDQPHAARVQHPGQLVPTEDPQAQEGGIEEEREQTLDGQRCAEDVAAAERLIRHMNPELSLPEQDGYQA